MRLFFLVFVCAGLCAGSAGAQTSQQGDTELNDLMAARSKVMIEAHQLQMEVRQARDNSAYTSPEIKALRKKIEDLQNILELTQNELRTKVEALPQVQAKIKKVEESAKKVGELNQKIEAKLGAD